MSIKTRIPRLCLAVLAISFCPLLPANAHAATITVNSAGDALAADGVVTLREAIASINRGVDANADVTAARAGSYGSSDAIHFAIGSGAKTITPTTALPALLKTMTIDGSTQPGFAGTPLITINGTNAGATSSGLAISSLTSSSIAAISVMNFGGTGIVVAPPGFIQPAIDMLLLSRLPQPDQADQNLDSIASSLGVSASGRRM